MVQFTEVIAAGPGWTTVRTEDGRTVTMQGARNWRNNNPGNLEYGPTARGYGAIGSDGRFAVFDDYNTGRAAKEGLLFDQPRYNELSIKDAISKYAPPVENNTTSYVNAITGALGVPASTTLSELTSAQRDTMMNAMQRVEGFRPGRAKGILGDPLDPETLQIDPKYGSIPSSVPTPSPRPGLGQADAAFGMMSALDPVRTGVVERGVLGPASAAPALSDMGRLGTPGPQSIQGIGAMREYLSPPSAETLSYEAMAQRSPAPTPTQSMSLADQYASYGQGRMAAQQALAPQIAAANLAQDVADRKATMPTMSQPQPAAAQPAAAQPQQNYVDPYVSASPTRPTAPGAISPSQQLSPNVQAQTFSQPPNNNRMKAGLGGIAGAVLGSAVAGPLGGALLGTIGANVMAGQPALTGPGLRGAFGRGPTMMANGFPSAPRLGLATRLSNFATGRDPRTSDLYRDSQQVRDAVDSGSAGLW